MNTSKPFVIFSAERPDRGAVVNADLTRQLAEQLTDRGIRFREVIGHYKGAQEIAFLCVLPGNGQAGATLAQIAQLARRYSQETVLYVDSNRQAGLYETRDGWSLHHVAELGPWREVSQHDVHGLNAYTEAEDRYYVAGPAPAARTPHDYEGTSPRGYRDHVNGEAA